jgi:hypothetical protein
MQVPNGSLGHLPRNGMFRGVDKIILTGESQQSTARCVGRCFGFRLIFLNLYAPHHELFEGNL